MQDDPPEDEPDEFDGMLDDAPSTGPHMPEELGGMYCIGSIGGLGSSARLKFMKGGIVRRWT